MYNQFSENFEYDECTARGSCSLAPSVAAVQEVILLIIKQCAFYIQKLKALGIEMQNSDVALIEMFSDSIISTAYRDEELSAIIKTAYAKLDLLREEYSNKCREFNISKTDIQNRLYLKHDINLSQIIAFGEKIFRERYRQYSPKRRNYIDLLTVVVKNAAKNLISIQEYHPYRKQNMDTILYSLNLLNKPYVSFLRYRNAIESLVNLNFDVFENLYKLHIEKFGKIERTNVNFSTKKGKAILVSGSNLSDLLSLLEYTKNESIDIYTHDSLLIAHSFSKFKEYKNLAGQFGSCQENCLLDFAVFPGAILITKNSNINTEYIYRGRIFTTSNIIPQGVMSIHDNEYASLVESANEAKGFAKGQNRPEEEIGFNEEDLEDEFFNLAVKIRNNTVKNIVILDAYGERSEYFKKLFNILPEYVYILSFSYNKSGRENTLKVNCNNNQVLMWKVLEKLNKHVSIYSNFVNGFFSKCDAQTITNIIYLKQKGLTNIYLTNCTPNSINPALKAFICETYGIVEAQNPNLDCECIIK